MAFVIPAISAALSLGVNYFGQKARNKAIRDAKKKAIDSLKNAYMSDAEIKAEADRTSDVFNSGIVNQANTVAYTGRNILNKGAFKGAALSKSISAKSGAVADTINNAKRTNRRVLQQIGEVEAGSVESFDPEELIATGLAGFQAGTAFEDAQHYKDKVDKLDDKLFGESSYTPSGNEEWKKFKSYMGKLKVNPTLTGESKPQFSAINAPVKGLMGLDSINSDFLKTSVKEAGLGAIMKDMDLLLSLKIRG